MTTAGNQPAVLIKSNMMQLLRRNRRGYLKMRESARALVHARLSYYNNFYNFSWRKVFIKNLRTRWGSCSELGNLNFNYKLVHLPPQLQDYIIVHELCHLKEFNHSEKFWSLISQTIPNHRTLRKQLRQLERQEYRLK